MEGSYSSVFEILAHNGPVRSLSSFSSGFILSGCQSDSPSAIVWKIETQEAQLISQHFHDHWVTALTHVSKDWRFFEQDVLITGCMDSKIRAFELDSSKPMFELLGHSKGVISFSWTNRLNLVSGSWDGSARVWDLSTRECLFSLPNHENGVNVLGLSSGVIVTTSTGESVQSKPCNFKVRFWDSHTGKQIGQEIQDHEGPIRSISAHESLQLFATSSNDGTIRVRTFDGGSVASLIAPLDTDNAPSIILKSAFIPLEENTLISCAENGSVIVWNNFQMSQVLLHPCCVWDVLPISFGFPGDFVTAGDDGFIRYFSKNPMFHNDDKTKILNSAFMQQAEQFRSRRSGSISEEEIKKAPLWDNRASIVGKSDQQIMVFNNNRQLIAAQWCEAEKKWQEIGQVMQLGDEKKNIDGVEFDHVLPVEVETSNGPKTYSLGYNNGENPYVAAQRFIDCNLLNQSYLSQIADWIVAQVPSAISCRGDSTSKPFLFEEALSFYSVFDELSSGFITKVFSKLKEINDSEQPRLSPTDIDQMTAYLGFLIESQGERPLNEIAILNLLNILDWRLSNLFPIFDILRVVVLRPSGNAISHHLTLTSKLMSRINSIFSSEISDHQSSALTALRFLCNLFQRQESRNLVLRSGVIWSVLSSIAQNGATLKKTHQHAALILLQNIAFYLVQKDDPEFRLTFYLDVVFSIFEHEVQSASSDAPKACLIIFGTLLKTGKFSSDLKSSKFGKCLSSVTPQSVPENARNILQRIQQAMAQ